MGRAGWVVSWCALAMLACGPSLRRLHRSDVYFERCDAADLDVRVPVEERRACWQAWLANHAEAAPRERVGYARERHLHLERMGADAVALSTGVEVEAPDAIQTEAATLAGAPSETAVPAASTPIPAADSSPDGRVDRAPPRRVQGPHPSVPPAQDAAACAARCRPAWDACAAPCGGTARQACLHACRASLRVCAHACY